MDTAQQQRPRVRRSGQCAERVETRACEFDVGGGPGAFKRRKKKGRELNLKYSGEKSVQALK